MKNTLIIYAHPYDKSFNHGILERVCQILRERGTPYQQIDLYQEGFDPRYSPAELALFSKGETTDPLVTAYQQKLMAADRWIFISPIWWGDLPAILKGFIDKVMKVHFAYRSTPTGLAGLLTHVRNATVLTTSASPTQYLQEACGDALQKVFVDTTLKQLGVQAGQWVNCGGQDLATPEGREKFLAGLQEIL